MSKILDLLYLLLVKVTIIVIEWSEKNSILERHQYWNDYIKITDATTNKIKFTSDSVVQGRKLKYLVIYHIDDLAVAPDGSPLMSNALFRQLTATFLTEKQEEEYSTVPVITFNPRFNAGLYFDVTGLAPIMSASYLKLPEGVFFDIDTTVAIGYVYYDLDYIMVRESEYRGNLEKRYAESSAKVRNQLHEVLK